MSAPRTTLYLSLTSMLYFVSMLMVEIAQLSYTYTHVVLALKSQILAEGKRSFPFPSSSHKTQRIHWYATPSTTFRHHESALWKEEQGGEADPERCQRPSQHALNGYWRAHCQDWRWAGQAEGSDPALPWGYPAALQAACHQPPQPEAHVPGPTRHDDAAAV